MISLLCGRVSEPCITGEPDLEYLPGPVALTDIVAYLDRQLPSLPILEIKVS